MCSIMAMLQHAWTLEEKPEIKAKEAASKYIAENIFQMWRSEKVYRDAIAQNPAEYCM